MEDVENEQEHLVGQDVHDMEEESQTEESFAPVSLLSLAEPVETFIPAWRLPYEQRIAWQTAEDELWKDAINQKVGPMVVDFFYNCSCRDSTL